jgi:V8-like Glu-specific endopeptidase
MPGKTKLLKLELALVLAIFTLLFTFGTSVPALVAAKGNAQPTIKVVMHQISTQDQLKALAYWTPARMEAAISADTLVKAPAHEPQQQQKSGSKQSASPFVPAGISVQKPLKGIQPDAYQLPHSSYSTFPYTTIGKVFFSQQGGNYVCSGTSVNSNNKSVVDTAGHCVIAGGSGNGWSSNWVFCPQYYYGSCPLGMFTARQLWTINYWQNYGWLEEDYGDAVVSPNNYGNVVNAVGGTGWAINYSYNQYFYAFGYPQAAPFDGNTMWYCPSGLYRQDNPSPGNASAMGITCNMTGGSSGGGWLISLNGTFGYVNGHNDYKYNNDTNHMYSPYYGNDWYLVFNSAQNS